MRSIKLPCLKVSTQFVSFMGPSFHSRDSIRTRTSASPVMTVPSPNKFFVVCKKSTVETNTSYYGCFYLGPFDESLSQTLSNDLRRTLLSELPGLAITSVEIEGVLHQFSSLKGLKEPVLDFICNLQTLVFKKSAFINQSAVTKKTYTGFLKARGPRIIKAKDLKLPPGIQCVDPNQYLATLAEDGLLNMTFEIHEGKGYVFQKPSFRPPKTGDSFNATDTEREYPPELSSRPIVLDAVFMPVNKVNCIIEDNNFATDVNIYRKSPSITDASLLDSFSEEPLFNLAHSTLSLNSPGVKKNSLFFKNAVVLHKNDQALSHFYKQSLHAANVKHRLIPILGIHTIRQTERIRYSPAPFQKAINTIPSHPKPLFLDYSFSSGHKQNTLPLLNVATSNSVTKQRSLSTNKSRKTLNQLYSLFLWNPSRMKEQHSVPPILKNHLIKPSRSDFFIKKAYSRFRDYSHFLSFEYSKILKLKPVSKKCNLVLEIWTNGSLHPRQALYDSFRFLSHTFLKLQKVKMSGSVFKSDYTYAKINTYYEMLSSSSQKINAPVFVPTKTLTNHPADNHSKNTKIKFSLKSLPKSVLRGNTGDEKEVFFCASTKRRQLLDPFFQRNGGFLPISHLRSLGVKTDRRSAIAFATEQSSAIASLHYRRSAIAHIAKAFRAYTLLRKAHIFTVRDLLKKK